VAVVLVAQAFALAIDRSRPAPPGGLVVAAVAAPVAALAWFKGAAGGADAGPVLPVGLSFLVLAVISYVIDVSRGGDRPVPLLDAAAAFTFFPRLLAGPVVRMHELAPQLAGRPDPRRVATGEAFALVLRGLAKKVVVAGTLAEQLTGPVLAAPAGSSRVEVAVAVIALAVQVYADVSGYLDIAAGVALLLGIRFPVSFAAPFGARSLTEFWSRWNLTVTRWFRDYVFRPSGRTPAAIVVTALAAALWHGPRLTFVAWGALHAAALLVERRRARPVPPVVGMVGTFAVVGVGWVLFTAPDLAAATAVFGQLVTGGGATTRLTPAVLLVIAAGAGAQLVPAEAGRRLVAVLTATPPAAQVVLGAAALLLIGALGPGHLAPFFYTRL
jgi:D-alanyl-lipoteichoic acid acyltransferase DltB (MBOAT superfamily)